jgi:hypothetical protein
MMPTLDDLRADLVDRYLKRAALRAELDDTETEIEVLKGWITAEERKGAVAVKARLDQYVVAEWDCYVDGEEVIPFG